MVPAFVDSPDTIPPERSNEPNTFHAARRELVGPNDYVRRYIIEAALRDPRYLPLLPIYFTTPEEDPVIQLIAANRYSLSDAEATYPVGLQRFFNKSVQVDPRGITPFLPYIICSELDRILSNGNADFVGEVNYPNNTTCSKCTSAVAGSPSTKEDPPATSLKVDGHIQCPAVTVQDDPGLSLRDFTSVALRIFNDIIFVVLMVVMAIVSVMVVCIMAPYVDVA